MKAFVLPFSSCSATAQDDVLHVGFGQSTLASKKTLPACIANTSSGRRQSKLLCSPQLFAHSCAHFRKPPISTKGL